MNFVTKNLGWILLILFFLFMLFVISSNDANEPNIHTGSTIGVTNTGEIQEDLDSLVDMIDKDEALLGTEKVLEEEGISDKVLTSTGIVKEKKESLFSKIFSRKTKEEDIDDMEDKDISEQTESGSVVIKDNKDGVIITPREELIGVVSTGKTSSITQNVMKKTGIAKKVSYSDVQKYAPEVFGNSTMYPGANLVTKIGDTFEVGVHSLKLNNKYFSQTLGYLMRGDSMKQLTSENKYGCFEVEIINSKLENNKGKTGYVCKKYLQETYEDDSVDSIVSPVVSEAPTPLVNTQIGDFITIENESVMLGDNLLHIGDIIDQMTNPINGCFTAHVYSSKDPKNLGQIGIVCAANLY